MMRGGPKNGFPRTPFQESRSGFLWTILIHLIASEAIKDKDSHGPGGICRPADAKHPGKQKERQRRELVLSRAVFCFRLARGLF